MFNSVTREDAAMVLDDGTRLVADLYRPRQPGRYPALLLRVPYGRRIAETVGYAHPAWYASHGFLVAVQDVRGRFDSGGRWDPLVTEGRDGRATVDWLASLKECNGLVATYGYSYAGAIQVPVAAGRPSGLVTLAPGFFSTRVRDDWALPSGVLAFAFCLSWGLELAAGRARREGDDAAVEAIRATSYDVESEWFRLPLRAACGKGGLRGAPWPEWAEHGPLDPYWDRYAELDVCSPLPMLCVGGWYDAFQRGTLAAFHAAASPQRLLMGPWWHAPWSWSAAASSRHVDDRQLEWFSHFLQGASLAERPPVEAFVLGRETWMYENTWPPTGAREMQLFLHSNGRANSVFGDGRLDREAPAEGEPPDICIYDPLGAIAARGGHSCCQGGRDPMGPADQAPLEGLTTTLVYTTEPLSDDLLIAGPVRLNAVVVTDCPETDFAATLCRVLPEGRSVNLVEGLARVEALNDRSPGAQPITIDLGDTCAFIAKGQRLRLDITGSRFPQWRRSLNRTVVSLLDAGAQDARVATNCVLHTASNPCVLTLVVCEP
jgi:putative CocE/NonD family hydrolase